VENTEFIRQFEKPDKAALKAKVGPMVQKYAVPFRFANVKMS